MAKNQIPGSDTLSAKPQIFKSRSLIFSTVNFRSILKDFRALSESTGGGVQAPCWPKALPQTSSFARFAVASLIVRGER